MDIHAISEKGILVEIMLSKVESKLQMMRKITEQAFCVNMKKVFASCGSNSHGVSTCHTKPTEFPLVTGGDRQNLIELSYRLWGQCLSGTAGHAEVISQIELEKHFISKKSL